MYVFLLACGFKYDLSTWWLSQGPFSVTMRASSANQLHLWSCIGPSLGSCMYHNSFTCSSVWAGWRGGGFLAVGWRWLDRSHTGWWWPWPYQWFSLGSGWTPSRWWVASTEEATACSGVAISCVVLIELHKSSLVQCRLTKLRTSERVCIGLWSAVWT